MQLNGPPTRMTRGAAGPQLTHEYPRYPGENGNDFEVTTNAATDTFKLPLPQLKGGDGMLIGMSGLGNPSDGDTDHNCPGVSPGTNAKVFPFVWQWEADDAMLSRWVNSDTNYGLDGANARVSVATAWKSDPLQNNAVYIEQSPMAGCQNMQTNGEFETLAIGTGSDCWSTMEWGAIDSRSQCSVGTGVSYEDGTYERIFAFFLEPDSYVWEDAGR